MRFEFISALKEHSEAFDVALSQPALDGLADYYGLVQEHNPILHLVAPCSPEEFAIRHILESLTLLEYLGRGFRVADVGTGAGLPSIPCLLVRPDLKAILIESKEKKTRFLSEAVNELGLDDRAHVINKQFEEVTNTNFSIVTCRALDKFTEKLPRIVRWARGHRLLLFGGNGLKAAIEKENLKYTSKLMPESEQRFLFNVEPKYLR